ncbi:MGMT family protein [Aeromicrobium sp.]|uniref:MGMT family protein n=1 Tax=Aeromicrobium sp. TaxID=1871063 RepID=UPI003C315B5A
MGPEFTERVLDLVDSIPRGRVLSFGMIAEVLQEGGPRQVGRVMALEGGAVAWWRVVRADGSLPSSLMVGAQEHYAIEGTPMRGNGWAVDMTRARWLLED